MDQCGTGADCWMFCAGGNAFFVLGPFLCVLISPVSARVGSLVALADTACGYGTFAALPRGVDSFTTIELESHFTKKFPLHGMLYCTSQMDKSDGKYQVSIQKGSFSSPQSIFYACSSCPYPFVLRS